MGRAPGPAKGDEEVVTHDGHPAEHWDAEVVEQVANDDALVRGHDQQCVVVVSQAGRGPNFDVVEEDLKTKEAQVIAKTPFLKSLVVTNVAKFNTRRLVFTFKYK